MEVSGRQPHLLARLVGGCWSPLAIRHLFDSVTLTVRSQAIRLASAPESMSALR